MNIRPVFAILMLVSTVTMLTGCESDEDKKLASAQACLDRASTTTDANNCTALISGLTSQSSYLIRCSANFIAQGFTASRLANAFQQVKDNTGGADPMVSLMGWFVFQSVAGNNSASDAVTNCTASGVTSMLRLATAANLATTLASYTGLGNFTSTDTATLTANMQAAIAAANGDPVKEAELGQVAVTAASAYCSEGSSYSGTEVCTNLQAAVAGAGGNYETIGEQLIAALGTNSGN